MEGRTRSIIGGAREISLDIKCNYPTNRVDPILKKKRHQQAPKKWKDEPEV